MEEAKGEDRPPGQEDTLIKNIRMLGIGASALALLVLFNYLMEGTITMLSILQTLVLVGVTGFFLWKR